MVAATEPINVSTLLDRLEEDGLPTGLPDLKVVLENAELTMDSDVDVDYDDAKLRLKNYFDEQEPEDEVNASIKLVGRKTPTPKRETTLNAKDKWVRGQIRTIQRRCNRVPAENLVSTEMPDGKTVPLYRPSVQVRELDGETVYVYASLDPEDGLLALTLVDYETYRKGGNNQFRHMPFASQDHFKKGIELLKEYSFFSDKCSYPNCSYNTREGRNGFAAGLRRKWELLVRNLMLAPGTDAGTTSKKVLELKTMCYVHWLLGESRDFIRPLWAQITVELQDLPSEEFRAARIARFVDLINEIDALVQQKVKAGGERPATKEEIGEMLISFATEITGGTAR